MTEGILFSAPERLAAHAAHDMLDYLLASQPDGHPLQRIRVLDDANVPREVEVPTVALQLLADALAALATGQAVQVVPVVRGTKD
jgi:hypothetical protein